MGKLIHLQRIMRVVEEIPHHTFKITVFNWNGKYLVKIEVATYEQTYKIDESSVRGVDDVKRLLTEEFLEACMRRFVEMRTDFTKAYETIKHEV